jgi:hypothetical protein
MKSGISVIEQEVGTGDCTIGSPICANSLNYTQRRGVIVSTIGSYPGNSRSQ